MKSANWSVPTPNPVIRGCARIANRAFTLVELLMVIATLILLISLTIPCLTRINSGNKGAQCQTNVRRLLVAWQMYADDDAGVLPPMLHGGQAQGGNFPVTTGPGWCEGWLDWTTATDNTNSEFLLNPKYARLGNYIGHQAEIFKCPADHYLSSSQRARGWTKRARSYSGSVGIGRGNAEAGPWDPLYRHITTILDFRYPPPAQTWVFIDEHPDSIGDPAFFSPGATQFIDIPATYHNGAASLGFADGHIEMHRWEGALTSVRSRSVIARDGAYFFDLQATPGDADLHWLSFHSQRQSTNSY